MSQNDPVLRVQVVRRVHPTLTVDVRFTLGREIGVIFGPSGSGKTTLLRLVTGLSRPDEGRITLGDDVLFDRADGVELPLRRRRIGMIFQDDLLFPHLDVRKNLEFGLRSWPRSSRQARAMEVAALCGVEHLLGRRPETLSGGERQRVGLARALAPRPRLLLCDEPVSAIDLDRRFDLLDRLRALQREESIPILYVTHSPAEALEIASRVFLMDAGTIQDEGPPLEMLTSTKGDALAHHKGFRNRFVGHVIEDADSERVTRVRLQDGPVLVVPRHDAGPSARVCVTIRAEDILLANGPVAGLSAQNLIPGVIDRVALHGPDAEVLVRVDGTRWIVSVVQRAVEQLDLKAGRTVYLILKSRSCELELLGTPGTS